jgi:hypothetical protein
MRLYVINLLRNAWPVVVIVGTIAGAAWTAAWNVRDFLRTEIAASESRLAAQIVATDARLTAQIAELRQLLVDHLEDHANAR